MATTIPDDQKQVRDRMLQLLRGQYNRVEREFETALNCSSLHWVGDEPRALMRLREAQVHLENLMGVGEQIKRWDVKTESEQKALDESRAKYAGLWSDDDDEED